MQPMHKSYSVAEESIQVMLSKDVLYSLYDEAKASEFENAGELSEKDRKKLELFLKKRS